MSSCCAFLTSTQFRKNVPLKKERINVNDRMQLLEPAKQVHCGQYHMLLEQPDLG
jgi:hypothetical protein